MRIIRETKKVIRVETGDGRFHDFKAESYDYEGQAREFFYRMVEEDRNRRSKNWKGN